MGIKLAFFDRHIRNRALGSEVPLKECSVRRSFIGITKTELSQRLLSNKEKSNENDHYGRRDFVRYGRLGSSRRRQQHNGQGSGRAARRDIRRDHRKSDRTPRRKQSFCKAKTNGIWRERRVERNDEHAQRQARRQLAIEPGDETKSWRHQVIPTGFGPSFPFT
jgi:hypothetical protein